MFQTFRLLYLFILLLEFILCSDAYVIYTTINFEESAEQIAILHSQTIPDQLGFLALDTEIIYKENINEDQMVDYLKDNFDDANKKYLLIIGDESIIEPRTAIYTHDIDGDGNIVVAHQHHCTDHDPDQGDYAFEAKYTDDLFNKDFIIGRFLVKNNEEALNQINNIENYVLDPEFGIWRNKALLIADDTNTNNEFSILNIELKHTEYTDAIYYNRLKDKMIVNTLYGLDYPNQQSMLTDVTINTINSGIGLINYIGHGTLNNLAHEDILVLDRDIELINTNNRPPIWVVGTCKFGDYSNNNNEISFTEELLKRDDAAIAVIATTAGILPTDSFNYLDAFYNALSMYLESSQTISRIGDIFKSAKSTNEINHDCVNFTYQLFGDPALPIMIAKQANNNGIFESPDQIVVGEKNSLNIDYQGESYIKIVSDDIIISNNDLIDYRSSGGTLFESYFSNQIDYYLPFDITLNSAKIIVYNMPNDTRSNNHQGEIQFSTVPIQISSNPINEELSGDNNGPEIKLYNNNIEIRDNTSMHAPYNFKIDITDKLPLNMSGHHNHNLLFWTNDEKNNALILNQIFTPTSDTSGTVILNFEDSKFDEDIHTINIESWDILNNNTVKTVRVNINQDLDEIFNIYNFPNPFNEKTFFTFHMNNPQRINLKIAIYSKTGRKIMNFKEQIDEIKSYHVVPESGWDGTDKHNKKLKNGTYFYHLNIQGTDGRVLHDKIHKLTILK